MPRDVEIWREVFGEPPTGAALPEATACLGIDGGRGDPPYTYGFNLALEDVSAFCGEAVADSILKLMNDRMDRSANSTTAMQESVERDRAILHAIETGDAAAAGSTARNAIAAYFADYLDADGALGLQALTGGIEPLLPRTE